MGKIQFPYLSLHLLSSFFLLDTQSSDRNTRQDPNPNKRRELHPTAVSLQDETHHSLCEFSSTAAIDYAPLQSDGGLRPCCHEQKPSITLFHNRQQGFLCESTTKTNPDDGYFTGDFQTIPVCSHLLLLSPQTQLRGEKNRRRGCSRCKQTDVHLPFSRARVQHVATGEVNWRSCCDCRPSAPPDVIDAAAFSPHRSLIHADPIQFGVEAGKELT